jgi:flagellar basal body-associated protein FliL
MTNINLLHSVESSENPGKKSLIREKVLFIPLAVLVGIFLIFGAAKFYIFYLSNQKIKIDKENQMELSNLSGKNVDRIVDFENRMETASKEVSSRNDYDSYLKELENLMVNGARLDSFKYTSQSTELVLVADNFKTAARQILSFKNSNYFKDLSLAGQIARDKDGNIQFTLKK